MGSGVAPLAVTAGRLAGLDSYAGFEVSTGEGWISLSTVESSGQLDTWWAALLSGIGHRGSAGSALGLELARVVVGPTVQALVLDGRCPDPALDNLAVRLGPDGYVSRTAVRGLAVAMAPHDEAAADPRSLVLAGEATLHAWWASRLAGTLTPLLAAVRARAPVGLPALWGGVSDQISGAAIWIGQLAERDPRESWQYAQRLLDALQPHVPVRLTRARPFPVCHAAREHLFQVRGTCCLYYRSAEAEGPPGDRYCSTCPLRDDRSRLRRLREHLATMPGR
jgi:hypothetical protein